MKYGHGVPLIVFLMALVLIGYPVLEFMFVAVAAIVVRAAALYTFFVFCTSRK